jgi:hypothetical protein
MLFWPAGMTLVAAWLIFHDPAFDYRLLVAGALLPDAVDVVARRPAVAHTLLAPVALLTLAMLATRRRRQTRRHLLAIPIGMFVHLVLDGMWASPKVLWWPGFGTAFPPGRLVPTAPLALAEEIVGLIALVWFVRRFRLTDDEARRLWWRTGRVHA